MAENEEFQGSNGGVGGAETTVFCVVSCTSFVFGFESAYDGSGWFKMAQEAGFGGPFGAQEVSPEGREIVSGGETSRHQRHFRIVFSDTNCASS